MKKIMMIIGFFCLCVLNLWAVTAPSIPEVREGTAQWDAYQARYQEGYDDAINGKAAKNYPTVCPCAAVICYEEIFARAYRKGYTKGLADRSSVTYDDDKTDYQRGFDDGYKDGLEAKASKTFSAETRRRIYSSEHGGDYFGRVASMVAPHTSTPIELTAEEKYAQGYILGYQEGTTKRLKNGFDSNSLITTPVSEPASNTSMYYQDGFEKGYRDGLNNCGYYNQMSSKEGDTGEYSKGYHDGYFAAIGDRQEALEGYERALKDSENDDELVPPSGATKAFKMGYARGLEELNKKLQQTIKGHNAGIWDAILCLPKRELDDDLPESYRNSYNHSYDVMRIWGTMDLSVGAL